MNLFRGKIKNWDDWGGIFQSIPAFAPLVRYILRRERLPVAEIANLTPGTNAVFRAGDYVVKLFAPAESGIDQTCDLQTELFAAAWTEQKKIPAPRTVAHGYVEDAYRFAYIVTEYVEGPDFDHTLTEMDAADKTRLGIGLREIVDKMNAPCADFNGIDVINDLIRQRRWDKYPERFKAERRAYIDARLFGEKVFVHGDLCGDNILVTPGGTLCILDFADAALAPQCYEHALVAAELFNFDPPLLRGFFDGVSVEELTDVCFDGMLIHDYGGDIVAHRIDEPNEFTRLHILRDKIYEKLATHGA